MISQETKAALDSIDFTKLCKAEGHYKQFDRFMAMSALPNPDIEKCLTMANELLEHCGNVSNCITAIYEAYGDDPSSISALIQSVTNEFGVPFFWNIVEELLRSNDLEVMGIKASIERLENLMNRQG